MLHSSFAAGIFLAMLFLADTICLSYPAEGQRGQGTLYRLQKTNLRHPSGFVLKPSAKGWCRVIQAPRGQRQPDAPLVTSLYVPRAPAREEPEPPCTHGPFSLPPVPCFGGAKIALDFLCHHKATASYKGVMGAQTSTSEAGNPLDLQYQPDSNFAG